MITLYNDALTKEMQGRYRNLFNNARLDLEEKGILPENSPHFTDIADYYSHMKDFMDIGKPIYLLLPLDEGHFTIDANTRSITVPPEFNACGGVTNDNLCEIATFTIDRYYDYTDLANPSIQVAVQWKNAAGHEGVTAINLIDLDTFFDLGKIRFGWPISKEVTEKEGAVTFAVKFYMVDGNGNPSLILNTLPATINIKKGLTIDPNNAITEVLDTQLGAVVANNISDIGNYPTGVKFVDYSWKDSTTSPKTEKINSDNTLVLTARAHTADYNELDYSWYRAEWTKKLDKSGNEIEEIATENKLIANNDLYDITYVYEKRDRVGNEKLPFELLYTKVAGEDTEDPADDRYEVYTGNDWPTNVQLYTKHSALVFKPVEAQPDGTYEKDITGLYFVKAENKKYKPGKEEPIGVASAKSDSCVLYRPTDFNYTSDLAEHKFIKEDDVTLSINFAADIKNPTLTHEWVRCNNSEGNAPEVVSSGQVNTATNTSLTVAEPGFYKVKTTSSLNRFTKDQESSICKVTLPVTPPGPKGEDGYVNNFFGYTSDLSVLKTKESVNQWISANKAAENGEIQWSNYRTPEDEVPKIIPTDVDKGGVFYLRVETDLDGQFNLPNNAESLLSDNLTYTWYYCPVDGTFTEIDESVRGEDKLVPEVWTDLHTNEILLRGIWQTNNDAGYSFKCKITNTLGGETASVYSCPVVLYNKV